VAPQIAKTFGITNPMARRRVSEKVVINMAWARRLRTRKYYDTAADELRADHRVRSR
jgi:ribosomal protein L5